MVTISFPFNACIYSHHSFSSGTIIGDALDVMYLMIGTNKPGIGKRINSHIFCHVNCRYRIIYEKDKLPSISIYHHYQVKYGWIKNKCVYMQLLWRIY